MSTTAPTQASPPALGSESYRRLFANANIGLALTGPDKSLIDVNPRFCEMLGYSAAELRGLDWASLTHPDDLDYNIRLFERMLAGETDSYTLNKRYLRKDGGVLHVHLTARCERDAAGHVRLVSTSIEDRSAEQAALDARKLSDERFRLLADSTLDGLWDWDIDADTLWLSSSWKAQLGYRDDELENAFATWDALLHPEDRDRVLQHLAGFLTEPAAVWQELFRLAHRDGSWRQILARGIAVMDAHGRPARIFGVHVDITEERAAAAKLKALSADLERLLKTRTAELAASEARYRTIAEYTIDWETWHDADGVLRYCSPACERLTGYPAAEFLRDPRLLERCVHPDDRPIWRRYLRTLLHDRQPGRLDYRARWRNGTIRWLERFDQPMHDDGGNFVGMRGSTRDITEVRSARLALEREKGFVEAVLNAAQALILVLAPDATVVRVNPFVERVTGWDPQELIGCNWIDNCLPKADRARVHKLFRRALGGTRTEGNVNAILTRDGALRQVSWYDQLLTNTEGAPEYVVAVGIDVTERLAAERALRETNERLEDTVQERTAALRSAHAAVLQSEKLSSLGTLVARLSHEINNPLMGILNYVAFAHRHTDGEVADVLAKADRELHRIAELLRNLLQFARPKTPTPTAVDLTRVVERAAGLLAADLRARGIRLINDLPAGLPPALGDPTELQQVLLNLLINARDAVSGRPKPRIRVTGGQAAGEVWLDLADSGPGVPPEARTRIFDPFFTTKAEGTGMGLTVSSGILNELGGSLTLRPNAGTSTDALTPEGAVFRLRLPRANAEQRDLAGT